MTKDVKIKIGGDTGEADATIGDLKRFVNKSFEEMKRSADQETREVTDAFRQMGIRSEKAIRESTRKAKENYQKIKNSGTASANDVKRAHIEMTKKIERNNRELGRSNRTFAKSFSDLKTPIKTVTKSVALLGAAVAAVGVALGAKAFGESVKFESAVLDLQKVLGDTEGKASDFIKIADELSTEFGINATEVLAGATNFKQAGFTIKEAFDLQRIAIETSIAGGISVEEASQRIIASLKGFNLSASEAGRITDVWNEVSNNFGTNLQEIAAGVSTLSPVAKAAGFSIEETAGLITPIIEVFGSGTEAANALKTGLVKLVRPTGEAAKKLEELGIETLDQNGALRSARDITVDLAGAFSNLTENQKLQTTAVLFGAEQAARLTKVFANFKDVQAVTAVALDATGSRINEVGVRMGSAEVQIAKAKTSFDNMARVIGDQFRDELTNVIGDLGGLATKFKELVEGGGLDPVLEKVRPQLEALRGGINSMAESLPAFIDKVTGAIEFMIKASQNVIDMAKLIKEAFEAAAVPFNLLIKGVQFLSEKTGLTDVVAKGLSRVIDFTPKGYRTGGAIRAQEGQFLPGYGGGDKIPVLAEAGEFVLRKEAVKKLGLNAVSAINRMDMTALIKGLSSQKVQKFQEGGVVQEPGRESVNVNLLLDGKTRTMRADKETANAFLNDIRILNIIHGRGKRPY